MADKQELKQQLDEAESNLKQVRDKIDSDDIDDDALDRIADQIQTVKSAAGRMVSW